MMDDFFSLSLQYLNFGKIITLNSPKFVRNNDRKKKMVERKIRNYCRPLVIFLYYTLSFCDIIHIRSLPHTNACTLEQLNSTAMTKYKCLVAMNVIMSDRGKPIPIVQCFCSLERETFVQWNPNVQAVFFYICSRHRRCVCVCVCICSYF